MGRKTMGRRRLIAPCRGPWKRHGIRNWFMIMLILLGRHGMRPVLYHLISMLNPADPQDLENFDPTRFSRHRPQAPPLNSAGFGVRDRPESQLSRALPLLV